MTCPPTSYKEPCPFKTRPPSTGRAAIEAARLRALLGTKAPQMRVARSCNASKAAKQQARRGPMLRSNTRLGYWLIAAPNGTSNPFLRVLVGLPPAGYL